MEEYTVFLIYINDKEDEGYHEVHKIVCRKDSDKYIKSALYGFMSKDIKECIHIKEYKIKETNSIVINPTDIKEAIQLVALLYTDILYEINRMNDYYYYKYKEK